MAQKAHLLIVDDEANTLASLSRAFRLEGHEATVCDNANKALELARSQLFDLILSDVVMPGKDGLALLEDLKAQGVQAPVVMMSGQAHIEMAVRATRLGALDFLEKPISTEKLLLTVDNALKLGREVSADGVLYGTVDRYKERVGADYAAASPASVSFSLKFVDLKSGQIVWTAKFAKSQAALSQNIFDLANFVQRSGRWVRAHEIAQEGVKEAVADLHGELNLSQNVKRFETGTYGELKSGQQRYNTGPNGIY